LPDSYPLSGETRAARTDDRCRIEIEEKRDLRNRASIDEKPFSGRRERPP
jgi:hypothetical protein